MLITTLLNQIKKFKCFVYKKAHREQVDGEEALVIDIEPRKNSKPVCRMCMKSCGIHATEKPRLFECVPLWNRSIAWAGKFLDDWMKRAMRTRLDPIKKVARMLRNQKELILNWFRANGKISNGAVEGLNLKAKLAMRKAYGFRGVGTPQIALYHTLGNLPEPKMNHSFC